MLKAQVSLYPVGQGESQVYRGYLRTLNEHALDLTHAG